MNRRRFLKATGYVLGAGALGLGGALWKVQPRRQWLPLPDGDAARPEFATTRRRVVVVGGGLAGLTAATELAARRFEVTLVERAAQLGGKLTAWTVSALGEQFPVEHGFHGFFAQYYNLRELLDAAGVSGDLAPSPGYPVLFGDRPPETFGHTTRLFPFNMLSVVRQSHALHLGDFRKDGDGLYDLMKYDGERTFERFDGIDFARFAVEGRINRPMVETVLEPFGKTTLNRLERLSAAEAIRFFHFYMMGNPEGLGFSYLRRDSVTAIVDPLRRRLEALGGQVRVGKGARRLERDGARIARVVVDAHPSPSPRLVLAAADVGDRWRAVPRDDGSSVFVRRRGDDLVALDGRCTHMGCPVVLDEDGFRCPCHGGRFDGDGRPTAGPPTVALASLVARRDGERVVVGESAPAGEEALACDYCVVACEVRGLQELMRRSDGELSAHVSGLGEADPYVVWRLWLDKPTARERLPFYTTSRFRFTDSLAIYSAFQEPFVSWARRTGGSVVEVHAYAIAPDAMVPAPAIRAVMWEELLRLLPELAGARVLHDEFQQQSNFSRFAPGDHARRPATTTPLANLMLAGDHVKLGPPAALMEAAAMSGRLAANAVLAREGLRQIPIPTVALKGPLA
ncbi:MAG: (2Fe-2S)-binding protein [Myxococcales bacterium]|nr:(2Fe-2S)-binding protein [Myxococcales bacterium]